MSKQDVQAPKMSKIVTISDPAEIEKMLNQDQHAKKEKELKTFLSCAKNNFDFLQRNLTLASICGSHLDPEVCEPVSRELRSRIARDLVTLLINGQKVNGKMNHWSNGGFGSRWCDMDAKKYGVDYIRAAFYSKTFSDGDWSHPTPFFIGITVEKASC